MSSFSSKNIKITPELEKYINDLIGQTELGEKNSEGYAMVSSYERTRVEATKEKVVDQLRIYVRTQRLLQFVPLVIQKKCILAAYVDLASLEILINELVQDELYQTLSNSNCQTAYFFIATHNYKNLYEKYFPLGKRFLDYGFSLLKISEEREKNISNIKMTGKPSKKFVKCIGSYNSKTKK